MLKTINNILEYSLLALATYLLAFTNYNYLLILPIFLAFFIIKYFHKYDQKKNLDIPEIYYTLGLVALYSNIFGEFLFEFYYRLLYYDKILHFAIPIYLTVITDFLLSKKLRLRMLFIVLIVLGLAAIWELFEFIVDNLSASQVMQGVFIGMKELSGGLKDTMEDLLYSLFGSLIGVLYQKN